MRILVITDHYPPQFLGGYELNCSQDVMELTRRGHELCVLTSRWGVPQPHVEGTVHRLLHLDPVWLASFTKTDPRGLRKRALQMRWALACRANYRIARRVAAGFKPDVAYIWRLGHVSIHPALALQESRVPTVYRIEDYWLSTLKYELCLEPNRIRRLAKISIVGLSRFDRIDLTHALMVSRALIEVYGRYGFREHDFRLVPEGVPTGSVLETVELTNRPAVPGHGVRLLFAGRLVPDKGPHIAIQALARLTESNGTHRFSLDIVGEGTAAYVQKLQSMVATLGLKHRVRFVGKLDSVDLLRRYAQYDALLFPSQWVEPFGVTIVEAMARGLPVIASTCGAAPEIIADGKNGLLIPPGDAGRLADAVSRLIGDPAFALSIRQAALDLVRRKYTRERVVDQIEDCLQAASALARNPRELPLQSQIEPEGVELSE